MEATGFYKKNPFI